MGSTPDARPTKARGDNQRDVIDHGHFYAYANKIGTIYVASGGVEGVYKPFVDYAVKGWWIDNMCSQHKLSNEQYLQYAINIRVGVQTRLRVVETVMEHHRRANLLQRQAGVAGKLKLLKNAFKQEILALVEPFAVQYRDDVLHYIFLVIHGASKSGKSTIAKSLGDKDLFGWGKPFIQTVQNAPAPDLRKYDSAIHGYLVFDNVNDQDVVLNDRAMFQSNNDIHTLGSSNTGIYAYSVWIYRAPVVITIDHTARWDVDEPWLRENTVLIDLTGPFYISQPSLLT
jgi:hypothetical protein